MPENPNDLTRGNFYPGFRAGQKAHNNIYSNPTEPHVMPPMMNRVPKNSNVGSTAQVQAMAGKKVVTRRASADNLRTQ